MLDASRKIKPDFTNVNFNFISKKDYYVRYQFIHISLVYREELSKLTHSGRDERILK